jgi:hypothetical protein
MRIRLLVFILAIFSFATTNLTAQDDNYFTGMEFNEEAYNATPAPPLMLSREYSALPRSSSLKKYCPTPKNQGQQGSCVGWSSTYSARTILYAKRKNMTNTAAITNIAFSPSYVYNQIKLGSDCSRGSYVSSAMELLHKQGSPKLADHPYACNQTITTTDKNKASKYKIKTYRRLSNTGVSTVDAIQKSLSEGNPVVIGMAIYSSFSYAKGVWSGVQDNYRGGHAMTIIGYDDNKYGGSFELMNSWGATWGNGGFIWVKYSDMLTNCKEYYEMVGFAAEKPKPKEDDVTTTTIDMEGSIKFVKSDNSTMYATLSTSATRDFNIIKKTTSSNGSESTYKLNKSQASGTEFRMYISNNEPAYVYIIGYGTNSGKVDALYPFTGYSAYLGYKKNNVAIPGEDYYVQLDNKKGKDYLCVLYSRRALNINEVTTQIQNSSGKTFNDKVKEVLQSHLVDGNSVTFDKNNINFKAKSGGKSIIPIIVEFDHI